MTKNEVSSVWLHPPHCLGNWYATAIWENTVIFKNSLFTILASECIGGTWGEAHGLLRFGPCIPMMLEFIDICRSIFKKKKIKKGLKTSGDICKNLLSVSI